MAEKRDFERALDALMDARRQVSNLYRDLRIAKRVFQQAGIRVRGQGYQKG